MKKVFFFLFSLTLCHNFFGGEEKNIPLTLTDCLQLARAHSKKIEIGHSQTLIAEAGKNEARSYLLPQISLNGRLEEKNTARDFSVFSEYGGAFSAQTFGVEASWLLYDFGNTWNQFQAGKKFLAASEMTFQRILQQVDEETKGNYFKLLEAQKMIEVSEGSIKTLEKQLSTTKDFYEQGIVAKTDLLTVEVQLSERKKTFLRAKNEELFSRMTLNKLIGQDLLHPLVLQEAEKSFSEELSSEKLVQYALSHRFDLRALKMQVQALYDKYHAACSAYAPKVFAFGGYNYMRDSFSNKKNWVSGGLGVQFSLYEGGKTSAQLQRARAQWKEASANLEDFERTIFLEVQNTIDLLQEQIQNIQLDQTAVLLAEENMNSISDRYKQGLVSINDVLRAEEQLSVAKMNRYRTLYRYHVAHARLLTVVGGNPFETQVK